MFDIANFVKACQGQPPSGIKELLEDLAALRADERFRRILARHDQVEPAPEPNGR